MPLQRTLLPFNQTYPLTFRPSGQGHGALVSHIGYITLKHPSTLSVLHHSRYHRRALAEPSGILQLRQTTRRFCFWWTTTSVFGYGRSGLSLRRDGAEYKFLPFLVWPFLFNIYFIPGFGYNASCKPRRRKGEGKDKKPRKPRKSREERKKGDFVVIGAGALPVIIYLLDSNHTYPQTYSTPVTTVPPSLLVFIYSVSLAAPHSCLRQERKGQERMGDRK